MNDHPTDDAVIARLRDALDEVAAGVDAGDVDLIPVRSTAPSPRRWLAVAAATVLLAGGAVWALSTRATDEPAAAPVTSIGTPTIPSSTLAPAAPSTITPPPHDGPWFAIESADLEMDEGSVSGALPVAEQHLSQAWSVRDGDAFGLVTVTIVDDGNVPTLGSPEFVGETIAPLPEGEGTLLRPVDDRGYGYQFVWQRADGNVWWFRSAGLSRELFVKAISDAVPGSGVPIVIPHTDIVTMLTVGSLTGESISQAYDAVGDGVDDVAAVMTVVSDGSTIRELMGAANVIETTVAGSPGYAALMDSGAIEVAWDAGNGWWGGLSISAAHARAADGIIAAVVPSTL